MITVTFLRHDAQKVTVTKEPRLTRLVADLIRHSALAVSP